MERSKPREVVPVIIGNRLVLVPVYEPEELAAIIAEEDHYGE